MTLGREKIATVDNHNNEGTILRPNHTFHVGVSAGVRLGIPDVKTACATSARIHTDPSADVCANPKTCDRAAVSVERVAQHSCPLAIMATLPFSSLFYKYFPTQIHSV